MRPEGCISDFAFDRHLARELDPEEEARTSEHLAGCARCRKRHEALRLEKSAFAKTAPPLFARPAAFPLTRRLFGFGAAFAAAAVVLLFFAFRREPAGDRDALLDGTRAKGGGAHLGFFVNHDGSVRPGGPSERVAPGDGLRFVASTSESRWLAVLSVDGQRHASIYYPATTEAVSVAVGRDVALPASTTLDDVLGDETIYGVFCAAPFAVEPFRHALEVEPNRAPSPNECTVDALHLRKEAPKAP